MQSAGRFVSSLTLLLVVCPPAGAAALPDREPTRESDRPIHPIGWPSSPAPSPEPADPPSPQTVHRPPTMPLHWHRPEAEAAADSERLAARLASREAAVAALRRAIAATEQEVRRLETQELRIRLDQVAWIRDEVEQIRAAAGPASAGLGGDVLLERMDELQRAQAALAEVRMRILSGHLRLMELGQDTRRLLAGAEYEPADLCELLVTLEDRIAANLPCDLAAIGGLSDREATRLAEGAGLRPRQMRRTLAD